ncbi:hypothetical protein KLP40_14055 [Hymenobacter sp. NST-14]|uniref:hypothetical protein n=1 Tax=Hymenobacter piscis TaxID=2839984 RepID=UPI001C02FAAB|nr:hypothetical protein [Hymenobacter piscis]MBT9394291.1 hypothetical protein [Hymenobacter piscis]
MKKPYRLLYVGLLLSSGCLTSTTEEIRIPAEQLAWQPYHNGDVLRFGQDRSSNVRTFLITEIKEEFIEYSIGGNAPVYLGPPKKIRAQTLDVYARRTDTVRYVATPASTPNKPDSVVFTTPTNLLSLGASESGGYAYLNWDVTFSAELPLRQITTGYPLYDTTQVLLPRLQLGGVAYDSVLRISNARSAGILYGLPRAKPVRRVYYAKAFGVVGFVEGGTLWYRLP